jgi:pimeloyl-ACP methyl ester carboxylesterase
MISEIVVPTQVFRSFLSLDDRQIHYRSSGLPIEAQTERLPLCMAHASPGSSFSLVPLMRELAQGRAVFAPDMEGNGDSDPPLESEPEIAWYAERLARALDALNLDRVDLYGSHTGAQLACEFALMFPDRVGRLVFDGIALFPDAARSDFLANYAPAMQPDDYGRHYLWAYGFMRDQFIHFPHFRRDVAHRRTVGDVPPAEVLHRYTMEVLKALQTYHLAYHAAFRHRVEQRLPHLKPKSLVLSVEGDPLDIYAEEACALLPAAELARTTSAKKGAVIEAFLTSP